MLEIGRARGIGRFGKSAATLILIVAIQGILAYRLQVFSNFDLPLIYCVYYGFTRGRPMASVFIGSGLGLLQDSLSGGSLGVNGFSKTLICFAAASAGLKFKVDQGITRIAALFLLTFVDGLVVTILGLTFGGATEYFSDGGLGELVLSGAFNTLLGLIMFGYHDRFGNAA
jgi:rod shape-determining protein MreD